MADVQVEFGPHVRTDIRTAIRLILADTNTWSDFEHKLKAYFEDIGESINITTNGYVLIADMTVNNQVYTIARILKDLHPRPEGADYFAITRSVASS